MYPTRRVHFAPTNMVYSPTPATPSPSMSMSSLPSTSSPDLPTPPPEEADYQPSIYPQMQIHYLLAFTPYTDPVLFYDLSHPPETHDPAHVHSFYEPATSPPLTSLVVIHPLFKWNITIRPSSAKTGAYVSVSDVLHTLHSELRLAVHPAHYADIQEGEAKLSVDHAYYSRCARIREEGARKDAERKGIKKIDFLMGQTRFMGLSGTLSGPDIWELNVSATLS
ncbi:hypothetical protein B0H34DRAFT_659191 [Crassisporium funariophilum]|nr:hypothetical protein B0H34DRAFT_659191 [Crassisporium funariophilum]